MKYALTYADNANDAWGTTDTIIFTTPLTKDEGIASLSRDEQTELVKKVLMDYGIGETTAEIIATGDWYYIRNCDDIDVEIGE